MKKSDNCVDDDENEESIPILPKDAEIQLKKNEQSFYLPMRYIILCMSCFTVILNYCLRMNWSVSILHMVRQGNQSEIYKVSVFDWDIATQQLILGVFFYGFTITPILGGWLVEKYGGFRILLIGVFLPGLMAAMTPLVAININALIVTRLLDGFGQGIVFPAIYDIIAKWTPLYDRSTFTAVATSGTSIGAILASFVSTWMCNSEIGWPAAFYLYALMSFVWCIFWLIFGSDEPANNKWISTFETNLILESLASEQLKQVKQITWKDMFKSPVVISLCVAMFGVEYGYFLLYADIPTFFEHILELNKTQSGMFSVFPHAVEALVGVLAGILADKLIYFEILSVTVARKLFFGIGFGISAFILIAVGYMAHNAILGVIFITVVTGLYGFASASIYANMIDIAPNHAGFVTGIVFSISGISGYIGPAVIGLLTNNNNTASQWRIGFWITGTFQIICVIIFLFFGSGEVQSWSSEHSDEEISDK